MALTPLGILVLLFVVLGIIMLPGIFHLAPFLSDTVLRARGSVALENSVRASRERNQLAFLLLMPALLLAYRYRLYDPSFFQELSDSLRLLALAGVVGAYLLLRLLLYLLFKPRRRSDYYQAAHRQSFTYFVLSMLLVLPTVGLLHIFGANDLTIKWFIYIEAGLGYLIFLLRRTQFLALSCNPLLTFLYLCGLELLPTAALVVSGLM